MKKIILTRKWPAEVEHALAERYDCEFNEEDTPFTHQQLQQAITRGDALLTTVTDSLDASIFGVDRLRTKIIANFGVGFSHIDVDAAAAKGIVTTNTPDVLSDCTADLAMTLLLMVARRASEGEQELRASQWTGWRPTHLMGTRVSAKTLGIIGFGRIGRAMAQRAHHGFGMDILVYNRSPIAQELLDTVAARQLPAIEPLLESADFVSLHCPGGRENTHLLNAERLALMKPEGYVINTARGEVIDEDALIDALQNHRIAGAGLDVFNNEPAIDPRFFTLRNAALLPHLGSATVETRRDMGLRVLSNLNQFFAGDKPNDQVV